MARLSFRPALELRGRKVKGLRGLAGKPAHPPLTDVPVGAYVVAAVLDVVAYVCRDSAWSVDVFRAAGITLGVGVVVSLATVVTGVADWLTTAAGTQMRRMANAHALLMVATTVVVVADLLVRFGGDAPDRTTLPVLGLTLLVAALVTVGGAVGGSMVYDFGFNVETATDHAVYHPSDTDVIHPHDAPPPS